MLGAPTDWSDPSAFTQGLTAMQFTGLWTLPAGQSTATRLIAGGLNNTIVLGSSPHLGSIDAIAVLAPKQLVMISGGKVLKATLP